MEWYTEVIFLLLIRCTTSSPEMFHNSNLPENVNDEGPFDNFVNTDVFPGEDQSLEFINQYEDAKLDQLGRVLATTLIQPWPRDVSPILYVESIPPEFAHDEVSPGVSVIDTEDHSNIPFKRSRYYRKYPWKRQNSRYDAENRYLCQPTKDDVFRLLVALHEARRGNRGQTVNFCNRRRPASVVFTNIRFLG